MYDGDECRSEGQGELPESEEALRATYKDETSGGAKFVVERLVDKR